MENTFDELQASIEKTDGRLQNLASSLTQCDHISETLDANQTESEVVEGLLETVKQVQSHYETFKEDLLELRELQKQIRVELRSSASELQRRIISLKLRMPESFLRNEQKNIAPHFVNEDI